MVPLLDANFDLQRHLIGREGVAEIEFLNTQLRHGTVGTAAEKTFKGGAWAKANQDRAEGGNPDTGKR